MNTEKQILDTLNIQQDEGSVRNSQRTLIEAIGNDIDENSIFNQAWEYGVQLTRVPFANKELICTYFSNIASDWLGVICQEDLLLLPKNISTINSLCALDKTQIAYLGIACGYLAANDRMSTTRNQDSQIELTIIKQPYLLKEYNMQKYVLNIVKENIKVLLKDLCGNNNSNIEEIKSSLETLSFLGLYNDKRIDEMICKKKKRKVGPPISDSNGRDISKNEWSLLIDEYLYNNEIVPDLGLDKKRENQLKESQEAITIVKQLIPQSYTELIACLDSVIQNGKVNWRDVDSQIKVLIKTNPEIQFLERAKEIVRKQINADKEINFLPIKYAETLARLNLIMDVVINDLAKGSINFEPIFLQFLKYISEVATSLEIRPNLETIIETLKVLAIWNKEDRVGSWKIQCERILYPLVNRDKLLNYDFQEKIDLEVYLNSLQSEYATKNVSRIVQKVESGQPINITIKACSSNRREALTPGGDLESFYEVNPYKADSILYLNEMQKIMACLASYGAKVNLRYVVMSTDERDYARYVGEYPINNKQVNMRLQEFISNIEVLVSKAIYPFVNNIEVVSLPSIEKELYGDDYNSTVICMIDNLADSMLRDSKFEGIIEEWKQRAENRIPEVIQQSEDGDPTIVAARKAAAFALQVKSLSSTQDIFVDTASQSSATKARVSLLSDFVFAECILLYPLAK